VTPIEISRTVELLPGGVDLLPGGAVLGAVTSNSCGVYLTTPMGSGEGNDPNEVRKLQMFLAKDPAIYPEGTVSGYYGGLTAAAVKRFQEKYAAEILTPLELTEGTGYAGASTIAKINALVCSGYPDLAGLSAGGATATPSSAGSGSYAAPQKTATQSNSSAQGAGTSKNPLINAIGSMFSSFW
jgi:peptidoglycan hydrolase-like protein with peptidoglycan-binding domain